MARLFLVTANVGSVFDNLEHGLPVWLNEFASTVRSKDPEFIAIHFQETGGKDCPNTIDSIVTFFRHLVSRMEQLNFRVAEAFVDTRSDLKDQYTALSSIYFVHESLRLPVHIWDFQDSKFHEISLSISSSSTTSSFHPNVHMGPSLDLTTRKQKEKFPQHFYPNCKWSRKGFLRTRWRIGTTVVDLVNIHLFHDSCNLIAASAFPSQFAQHREKTLKYTLDRIQSDGLSKCPLFIFGDFNFRINANGVMDILRKDFDIPGAESEIIIASKKFQCPEQELRFKHSYEWLKQHDFECKQYSGLLQEFDLNFHPTYPFDEDIDKPEKFMRTRLPAWCDRVLFTPSTVNIVSKDFPIDYNLIGSKVCMGDHKPVSLLLKIKTDEYLPTSTTNCNPTSATNNETTGKGKSTNSDMMMMLMTRATNQTTLEIAKFPTMTPPKTLPVAQFIDSTSSTKASTSSEPAPDDFSHSHGAVEISSVSNSNKSDAKLNGDGAFHDGVGKFSSSMEIMNSSSHIIASNDNLGLVKPFHTECYNTDDGKSPTPPAERKCFSGLFRFRGRMRFPPQGGGGGGVTGDLASRQSKSYFGFSKAFSRYKKGGGGNRSGSLLEPIAYAACEPPISSLPSSGAPSKRPSVFEETETTSIDDIQTENDALKCLLSSENVNLFTVPTTSPYSNKIPNGTTKLPNIDYRRKCGSYCGMIPVTSESTPLPPSKSDIIGCSNEKCASRLMMMINNSKNYGSSEIIPIGSSNLSLIALNSDLEKKGTLVDCTDEPLNGKIPLCWTTSTYDNCPDCCLSMNNKNLQNSHLYHHHQEKSHSGKNNSANLASNGLNCRGRSASQCSGTVQAYKTHLKEGMSKTSAAAGDCISCSKCVIL